MAYYREAELLAGRRKDDYDTTSRYLYKQLHFVVALVAFMLGIMMGVLGSGLLHAQQGIQVPNNNEELIKERRGLKQRTNRPPESSEDEESIQMDPLHCKEEPAKKKPEKFEEGEGKAYLPVKLRDYMTDIVSLPPGADGRRQLAIPPDVLRKLNGKCITLDEYEPSSSSEGWQCNQKDDDNFPHLDDINKGTPYKPGEKTLEIFAKEVELSVDDLKRIRIGSGLSQENATDGHWCSMPDPGDPSKPEQKLVYDYWKTCVMPRAGYFNALQCGGNCDEDGENCSTYAVLGYAALEGGVCYVAHQHENEEAYWQIAGRGWWRTWTNVSVIQDSNHTWASNTNYGGSKFATHVHRAGVPHEMDTTNNLDNDGGDGFLMEPMVMVYWWAMDKTTNKNYRWAEEVRENPYNYQESAVTCGNYRRIPKYDEDKKQKITAHNC